ncbi:hypothetical protein DESA109040_09770 [Deinococcus saxicola]|uniref:CHASE3 domain-containing protein n=1 Tax=Deinococcus saxicola TaxID=249406 RepID=UPI0039EEF496
MTLRRLRLLSQVPFWILLVAAFVLLSGVLDARVQATEQAAQTRASLTGIGQVMQHVVDMETGLRGYIIAGQPAFLEPYEAARAALPTELAVLDGAGGGSQHLACVRTH